MTSNFTAAELRAMVPRVSVASFAEIAVIQAMLREYAALKEAAQRGVTDEVVKAQQADIIILHDKLTAADDEWAASVATVAQLERTIANQAAALAERDKELERYRLGIKLRNSPEGGKEKLDAALAASVSSASEEGGT